MKVEEIAKQAVEKDYHPELVSQYLGCTEEQAKEANDMVACYYNNGNSFNFLYEAK